MNAMQVLEIAEYGSLYQVLHSKMDLSFPLLLRFAHEAACGLSHLHQLNPPVLHRDIKSPNFLVNADMRVLLSDFGLAKVKTETKTKTKTQGQGEGTTTTGSIRWMAPERFGFKPYTAACDVFSFGVLLWELTTREVT